MNPKRRSIKSRRLGILEPARMAQASKLCRKITIKSLAARLTGRAGEAVLILDSNSEAVYS